MLTWCSLSVGIHGDFKYSQQWNKKDPNGIPSDVWWRISFHVELLQLFNIIQQGSEDEGFTFSYVWVMLKVNVLQKRVVRASIFVLYMQIKTWVNLYFPSFSRMYSSIEKPSCSTESQHNQFQYHLNAFNIHSTANTKTSTGTPSTLAPKSNGNAKLTVRPSSDKQSSTILNNNSCNRDRNKYSNGAYTSTCSNNNFESAKQNTRTTMFNEKMWVPMMLKLISQMLTNRKFSHSYFVHRIPRGPYLQYKMSENDNKSNYLQPNYYFNGSGVNGSVEALKEDFTGRGILPRAKIMSNSVLDASGVDYNLRTQTIGRYHPLQQTTNVQLKKPLQNCTPAFVPSAKPQNVSQQMTFSCHTLPITRRENQQKEQMNARIGSNLNHITLESALNVKAFHQLSPTQGWALLCQSVQALQDLFLSGELKVFKVYHYEYCGAIWIIIFITLP